MKMFVSSWNINISLLVFWAYLFAVVQITSTAPAPASDGSVYDRIEEINKNSTKKLFEGDILPEWLGSQVLGAGQDSETTKREAKRYAAALWPTRVIPYEITTDFSSQAQVNAVLNSFKVFEEQTCLKFKQRTTEKHWIKFQRLDGCYSNVGRVYWKEGAQTISLGPGCLGQTTVLHEIMHAIGFWHEQSRPDRDKYVEIFWENIVPDQVHNFNKYSHQQADLLGVNYDYQSLMHYGRNAFSKNGERTMQAIGNSNLALGQRLSLGASDLIQINALYDCASHGKSIWSTWSSYGPCDSLCVRTRHRFCSHQNLTECVTANEYGVESERTKCSDAECYAPLDGHWGRWSSWTSCDKDCGPGKQNRSRSCDNPAPKYGGKDCQGSSTSEKDCQIKTCGLGKYDCEFDGQGWCLWQVDPNNNNRYTWALNKGKTPSSNTGPPSDHTSGSGNYIYAEGSAPARSNDIAKVSSPEMPATTGLCLKFWYHMFGLSIGTLKVIIRSSSGIDREIWSLSGDQGNQWLQGNKTIVSQTPFKVIFESIKGSSYLSDTALDDIKLEDGSCEKSAIETLCGVRMKPRGCYGDSSSQRALQSLEFSYRNPGGYMIDWLNYPTSLERVVCDCAKAAKNSNSKYFGIQYYAECWTGSAASNYTKYGSSTSCVDGSFDNCADIADKPCSGQGSANYVYELM